MKLSFANLFLTIPLLFARADVDIAAGPRNQQLTLTVTNIAFFQPFSAFVVIVHNDKADPIYKMGEEASAELRELAENGDPGPLRDLYDPQVNPDNKGKVLSATVTSGPTLGGASLEIPITVKERFPLVSIAAMAVNTNDALVTMNGVEVYSGQTIFSPGIDAGTEANNQLCKFIPGPACGGGQNKPTDGLGEGFVHVHRGIFAGVGNIPNPQDVDWRNPMMRVKVTSN